MVQTHSSKIQRSTGTRQWPNKYNVVFFYLRLHKNKNKWQDCSISTKNKKAIHSPMFNHHSLIPWGSFRGRQEEKWGSFRGRDHFGVDLGIISGSGSFRLGGCTSLKMGYFYWLRVKNSSHLHTELSLGYPKDTKFYLESKASFIFLVAWLREYCTFSDSSVVSQSWSWSKYF